MKFSQDILVHVDLWPVRAFKALYLFQEVQKDFLK